jgi:signal transduction histidine kinase
LYRAVAGEVKPFVSESGPGTNSFVWSFAHDASEQLWVSTAENGVFALEGERFHTPAGLENFPMAARVLFRSASQGGMLLGGRIGLFRYADQRVSALATNLVAPDVRCIVEQTNGVVWFGMFGGGLGRLEKGVATQFRKAQGLASDFVQALYLDTDDALWIGTAESGLTRLKDDVFRSVTTANGLRDNVICHIGDDGRGSFWISSNAGIMRVKKDELNRCADGAIPAVQCLSFGETDGLPSAQCSGGLQPTGCRTADGAMWFATLKGIVAIDPEHVRTNQLPSVLIEEMRVNDTPVRGTNGLAIEPGRQRFDFDFTAISFAAPERVLFQYRLQGVDENWIGPTTKRTISYSHLNPGDYTFRVIACNSDGAWNLSEATLAFTVLPFFWQTLWFRAAIVLASLGLVGLTALLVTRARYRRQLELAERQRGIERERARIAQDIHDDLGSSLTRIILLSQSARGDLDSPELAASDLDRIYETARNLTRSLDEIVWAVNPRHDTLDSLATYLGKFAQDFLGAADIRCRLDLPVSLPSWPLSAETRHNVFLAFKESLNNTVKHAQATEVRVSLALEASAFTLALEDNGKGFDTSAKNADTDDGLRNMRKRLAEIGGSCEIKSEPGNGTQIRFKVPVAPQGVK